MMEESQSDSSQVLEKHMVLLNFTHNSSHRLNHRLNRLWNNQHLFPNFR